MLSQVKKIMIGIKTIRKEKYKKATVFACFCRRRIPSTPFLVFGTQPWTGEILLDISRIRTKMGYTRSLIILLCSQLFGVEVLWCNILGELELLGLGGTTRRRTSRGLGRIRVWEVVLGIV